DGSIKPFKGGGIMLATRSSADVVPMTIRGSRAVLVPKTYHIRGGAVEVIIGEPIPSEGVASAELANRVRDEIVTTFNYGQTLDRNSYSLSRKICVLRPDPALPRHDPLGGWPAADDTHYRG